MRNVMFLFLLSSVVLSSAMTYAQVPARDEKPQKDKLIQPFISGDYTSRYFGLQSSENHFNVSKIQGALTLDVGANFGKKFSTHAVLVQTPSLGKRFYTIYDFNKPTDTPALFDQKGASILPSTLFIQKLYAQFENNNTKFQVGTIPKAEFTKDFKADHKTKTNTLENSFMGSNAWVDGVRITQNVAGEDKPAVLLTLTVGALNDLSTPYMQRNIRKPNYAEAQFDFGNCKGALAEGSVGIVDDEVFIRTGLEDLIKVTDKINVKLYSETLYNVTDNEIAAILGYQTDLLKAFNPKLDGRVNLGMEIAYIDKEIGPRGMMGNDAFLAGKRFRIQLSGKINKNGNITWFTQKDFGTNNLISVGTKIAFKK